MKTIIGSYFQLLAVSVYIFENLNKIALVKMKILCYNKNPFLNKALRKTIMRWSKLKNKINKNALQKIGTAIKLLRQTKKK